MNAPPTDATPLVAIVGPTASGKSALGIELAERLNGEVVVCDSTQLYRRFDIGTAKVSAAERRGIPHHLVDLLEPEQVFTAGDYRRHALDVLADLRSRGKLPIFTVGTGLYFRALVDGLADAPARSEELRARLRKRADTKSTHYLHRVLQRLDAEAAARISPRDTPKIIRAIEVCVLAGKPMSEVLRAARPQLEGFVPIKVGLMPARAELYQRINPRVHAMLDGGWLEEVRGLLAAGVPATVKPFQFIGYGDLRAHLEGVVPLPVAVKAIQQATRRYAKRQITWFRREAGVEWFAGFGDQPEIVSAVLQYLSGQPAARILPRASGAAGV
jgi:tRNA dimethylallyltransferase